MGRELSSFTDLQKSLAQLGFNSGNLLIRLSFRRTEEPLEKAMVTISEYFKSAGDDTPMQVQPPATTAEQNGDEILPQSPGPAHPEVAGESNVPSEGDQHITPPAASFEQSASTSDRPITVFSPPSASTPSSAQIPYNDDDYVPSVEHAKAHQRLLNQISRPQRLPTDAEIAAKAAAEEKRLADIREVDVKVRFPDQSQIVAKFGPSDTGQSLYNFVRSCMAPAFAGEKFALNAFVNAATSRSQNANVIPDSDQRLLIKDLGLAGRVLINFSWADNASSAAHQQRSDILRPELRSQARELKVEQPPEVVEEPSASMSQQAGSSSTGEGGKPGGPRKSGGIPKWLKLPGKK